MEEELKPIESDEMGVIILMLGLYLIVLAFFILLNAISETSEAKAEQTKESLAEGFGFQTTGPVSLKDDVSATVDPLYETMLEKIQGILESHVSIKDYRLSSNNDKMLLRLKSPAIFMPRQVRIRPAMAEMFTELSDMIANTNPSIRVEADILVEGLPAEAEGTGMTAQELAGRRSSLFVRALVERGVKEQQLSAQAIASERPEVKIFFRTIVVDEAEALKEAERIMRQREMRRPVAPGSNFNREAVYGR